MMKRLVRRIGQGHQPTAVGREFQHANDIFSGAELGHHTAIRHGHDQHPALAVPKSGQFTI